MNKVHSFDELKALRASLQQNFAANDSHKVIIRIAMATCSIASGSDPVMKAFAEELPRHPVEFVIKPTGCTGYCHSEPTVEITRPGEKPVMFGKVNRSRVLEIIQKFIVKGEPVEGVLKED